MYCMVIDLSTEDKWKLKIVAAKEGKSIKELVKELIINKVEGEKLNGFNARTGIRATKD